MKEKGEKTGTWVPNELDTFLTKPENVVPGTRMIFPGLPDQQERADIITYLNTQSDNPLPDMRNMPKEAPLDLPTRLARADVAKGERSVSKCAICHTIEKDWAGSGRTQSSGASSAVRWPRPLASAIRTG